jgi:hypothetical protein
MSDEPVDIIQHAAEVEPVAEQETSATTTEETASPEGETPEGEPKPESKTFTQKDVDKIVQKEKAKVERKLMRQQPVQQVETKQEVVEAKDAPNPDNYTDYSAYVRDLAKFEAKQEFDALQRQAKESETKANQEREVQSKREKIDSVIEAGEDKYDDFRAKVTQAEISKPAMEAILECDNPHDIVYYLASNDDEAQRLLGLSPAAQAKEIGKLEDKLLEKKPVKPSSAPAPVTPVKGGKTPTTSIEDMDMDTFIAEGRKRGAIWARNR